MNMRSCSSTCVTKLLVPLTHSLLVSSAAAVMLAIPPPAVGQHQHYKLIVLGTLGGPRSYGDPGYGAANINNQGIAAGVADTGAPDPFFPNFSPLLSGQIGMYPLVYHVFVTKGGVLVDLGGLPGGNSVASFITENGLVSGESLTGSLDPLTGWPAENAVLWKDGKIINLGTLGGYESGAGWVNSRGQVVGASSNMTPDPCMSLFDLVTQTRAFMWEDGKMQDLGTLGGPDAAAVFINERGQAAGLSYTDSITHASNGGFCTTDPFLWDKGKMIDLGTLGGTFGSQGEDVGLNNRGQVVGQSNLAGDLVGHAFLWPGEDGKMRDLGTLGGDNSIATAINDAGEITGYADTADSTHAFFWKNGQMTDLGPLEGDCFSAAFGINSRGQVVGGSISCDSTTTRAVLWEHGQITDLNAFVPPGVELTLTNTEKINERGEVFGMGILPNGDLRAFLLVPVGEDDPAGMAASPKGALKSSAKNVPTSAAVTAAARAQLYHRRHGLGPGLHLGLPLAPK